MSAASTLRQPAPLSLHRLLDPDVLADPYPLYRRFRESGPVLWDPYLHTWVVTGYDEVVKVFQTFSAERTPTPQKLKMMGLSTLEPVAEVMVRQMLFLDGAAHSRLRGICSAAFTSRRIEHLKDRIRRVCDELLGRMTDGEPWELLGGFAEPLPAIITADLLGLPSEDWQRLKGWSASFAGLLGNFQHSPDQARTILRSVEELSDYVRRELAEQRRRPREGLIGALLASDGGGGRLDDDQIVANVIVTLVGGLETTTNLIATGLVTLLDNPDAVAEMRRASDVMDSAVEELLRYESPSQHTGRIAPHDVVLGGQAIARGEAVMAVMAAANRDPAVFPDPDRLDIRRTPNRHVAFAWGSHFCFGAPLARLEGRIAFAALFRHVDDIGLAPRRIEWRENLGLRGPKALWVVPRLARRTGHAPRA